MPQLGESIAEATVKDIKIEVGQTVETDEDVLEVETEKAMMEVTTPHPGKIVEILAKVDVSYPVGSTLGYLEIDDTIPIDQPHQIQSNQRSADPNETASTGKIDDNSASETRTLQTTSDNPNNPEVTPTIRGLPVPARASGATYISPRLRARMQELGLNTADLAGIAGTGAGGINEISSVTLTYPDEFEIKYYVNNKLVDGSDSTKPLFKIHNCFMESFATDYTTSSLVSFLDDDQPLTTTISMSFKETQLLTKADIDAGY